MKPLLAATDERARACAIEALLRRAAETIARVLQRHRGGAARDDLDDIRSTVNLRLVRRLRQPLDEAPIANFPEYVATITYNAVYDYLRKRYPERMRLKNRIRYVLGHDARFAAWETPSGTAAGLSAWAGRDSVQPPAALHSSLDVPGMSDRQRTAETLGGIFARAAGPMAFDELVSLVARLWNVQDLPHAQPVEIAAPESSDPHVQLEARQYLERLWGEIRQLLPMQRAALLLNLRDADGRNAMVLLLLTGIASAAQLADALEMAPQTLVEIWSSLPLDDLSIAAMLGRNRQQVINLRKAARERLARRMNAARRKP